jgi:hypothetical protein
MSLSKTGDTSFHQHKFLHAICIISTITTTPPKTKWPLPPTKTSLLQPCNHPHRNTLASEVTFETSVLKMNRVYSAMTSSPQPNNILLCYPCPDSLSTKACYRYILMQCSTHLRSSAVPTSQQRIVPRRLASQRRWQRSLQTQQSTITKAICCPN